MKLLNGCCAIPPSSRLDGLTISANSSQFCMAGAKAAPITGESLDLVAGYFLESNKNLESEMFRIGFRAQF